MHGPHDLLTAEVPEADAGAVLTAEGGDVDAGGRFCVVRPRGAEIPQPLDGVGLPHAGVSQEDDLALVDREKFPVVVGGADLLPREPEEGRGLLPQDGVSKIQHQIPTDQLSGDPVQGEAAAI